MYPLRAELKHNRVATTNRIGEGLKSSDSGASVMMPSCSGGVHSLAVDIIGYDCCLACGNRGANRSE